MRDVSRLRWAVLLCALGFATPALASTSSAQLWAALGGRVTCSVAIHRPQLAAGCASCAAQGRCRLPSRRGSAIPASYFSGQPGVRRSRGSVRIRSPARERSPSPSGRRWEIGPMSVTCQDAALVRFAARTAHITVSRSRPTPTARSERARAAGGRSDRRDQTAPARSPAVRRASAQALPLTS